MPETTEMKQSIVVDKDTMEMLYAYPEWKTVGHPVSLAFYRVLQEAARSFRFWKGENLRIELTFRKVKDNANI